MSYRVITIESDEAEGVSSPLASEETALGLVADLIVEGVEIARIVDRNGATVRTAEEVKAWYAARTKKQLKPR